MIRLTFSGSTFDFDQPDEMIFEGESAVVEDYDVLVDGVKVASQFVEMAMDMITPGNLMGHPGAGKWYLPHAHFMAGDEGLDDLKVYDQLRIEAA